MVKHFKVFKGKQWVEFRKVVLYHIFFIIVGFVRQKRKKKVPSFIKQKGGIFFRFFWFKEPGTDLTPLIYQLC
jgi:hypothetical protein